MNDGTTPLILAARLAVEGMVAELISCQADVNAVDDHGRGERQGFESDLQSVPLGGRGAWLSDPQQPVSDPDPLPVRPSIHSLIYSFILSSL